MEYADFVWFLLAEEVRPSVAGGHSSHEPQDKSSARSIEYWFRCMDRDGDGYITYHDMDFFYSQQVSKFS
jgi:serine/threonine-protein phosphatase 2A regulatory subunit B''